MRTGYLLDVPQHLKSNRVRLTEFKREHGIQTHHAKHLIREEYPWMAIIPFDDDKDKSIGEIMAASCQSYEDAGYSAIAEGEMSAVRKLCKQLGITCGL